MKKYFAQINDYKPGGWQEIFAECRRDAAVAHLNRQRKPLSWLPCTVNVLFGKPKEPPYAFESFKIELTATGNKS